MRLTGRPKWSKYRASIAQRRLEDHIALDYGWVDNTVIYHPPSCMGKLWRWCCCIVGVYPPIDSRPSIQSLETGQQLGKTPAMTAEAALDAFDFALNPECTRVMQFSEHDGTEL